MPDLNPPRSVPMKEIVALPATSARLPHPDRVAIWPTEAGYGVDVTWTGPDGLRDADRLKGELNRLGMTAKLIQGMRREWTTRVGPVPAEDARQVVNLFLR